jgi:hypothetical protein
MKATKLETCLRPETASVVKELAEEEQRSVSSMLRILVEEALKRRATQAIVQERAKALYRRAARGGSWRPGGRPAWFPKPERRQEPRGQRRGRSAEMTSLRQTSHSQATITFLRIIRAPRSFAERSFREWSVFGSFRYAHCYLNRQNSLARKNDFNPLCSAC